MTGFKLWIELLHCFIIVYLHNKGCPNFFPKSLPIKFFWTSHPGTPIRLSSDFLPANPPPSQPLL